MLYSGFYLLLKQKYISPKMAPSNKTTPQLIPMSSSGVENLRLSIIKCSQRIPLNPLLHLKKVEIMLVRKVSGSCRNHFEQHKKGLLTRIIILTHKKAICSQNLQVHFTNSLHWIIISLQTYTNNLLYLHLRKISFFFFTAHVDS